MLNRVGAHSHNSHRIAHQEQLRVLLRSTAGDLCTMRAGSGESVGYTISDQLDFKSGYECGMPERRKYLLAVVDEETGSILRAVSESEMLQLDPFELSEEIDRNKSQKRSNGSLQKLIAESYLNGEGPSCRHCGVSGACCRYPIGYPIYWMCFFYL